MYVCMFVRMYVCMCRLFVYLHAHIHVRLYIYIHIHIHIYVYTHIFMYLSEDVDEFLNWVHPGRELKMLRAETRDDKVRAAKLQAPGNCREVVVEPQNYTVNCAYMYVYIYIYGHPPLTTHTHTHTPLKNTVNTDKNAILFRIQLWSCFYRLKKQV